MSCEIHPRFSIKIDVDTHEGMKKGVPVLLEILRRFDILATFCLSFGPDHAGRAVFRLFKDPRFLKKMVKTRAPGLYGLRTILSGTLLPARPIATAFPDLVREIEAAGHEVIVHAWNHRRWQEHLTGWSGEEIRGEFEKAFLAFEEILGRRPEAVAAPGWQATAASLAVQDGLGLLYASDLREGPPCLLKKKDRVFQTLQIPTTGPCVEELLASGIKDEKGLTEALVQGLSGSGYPVLAVHAEVEGGVFEGFFTGFLETLLSRYERVVRLRDYAVPLLERRQTLPIRNLIRLSLPGRAGWVASSR